MESRYWLTVTSAVAILSSGAASALTQEQIDEIRGRVSQSIREGQIGAGYAQLLGFVTDPDVSGITLRGDDAPDDELQILKLPLQFRIGSRADWDFFFRAGLNYATYEIDDILRSSTPGEKIETEYTAYSGSLGIVAKRPLNASWTFAAALDVGAARFENDTSYAGGTMVLAPVLDDLLFNWTTNAGLVSGVLGLEYAQDFDSFGVSGEAHYIHSYVSSFGESGDFVGFREHTDTIHLAVDVSHPWGTELGGYPLLGVVHLGNTTFLGNNREALGFDTLWSVGYALQLDVSRSQQTLKSIRLGLNYLKGNNNYDGYEIVLGYRF